MITRINSRKSSGRIALGNIHRLSQMIQTSSFNRSYSSDASNRHKAVYREIYPAMLRIGVVAMIVYYVRYLWSVRCILTCVGIAINLVASLQAAPRIGATGAGQRAQRQGG